MPAKKKNSTPRSSNKKLQYLIIGILVGIAISYFIFKIVLDDTLSSGPAPYLNVQLEVVYADDGVTCLSIQTTGVPLECAIIGGGGGVDCPRVVIDTQPCPDPDEPMYALRGGGARAGPATDDSDTNEETLSGGGGSGGRR